MKKKKSSSSHLGKNRTALSSREAERRPTADGSRGDREKTNGAIIIVIKKLRKKDIHRLRRGRGRESRLSWNVIIQKFRITQR